MALGRYVNDTDVRVPIVEGLGIADARRLLAQAGLDATVREVESRTGRVDEVVEQVPAGGTLVRVGRTIDLAVAVATAARRMPTLVGAAWGDAATTVVAAGLADPDVSFVWDERPYGTVVGQRPLAGDIVPRGARTAMVVSRGVRTDAKPLPDLFGVPAAEAEATLRDLGFRSVDVVTEPIASIAAGSVARQRPPAGTLVELGRPIVLSVALEGDRFVRVPDVAGMPTWQARVALLASGLNLGPIESVQLDQAPSGVVGSRPEGLTVPGAPVSLIVNVRTGDAGGDPAASGDGTVPESPSAVAGGREPAPTGEAMLPEGARALPFLFDPTQMGVPSLLDRPYRLTLVVRDDEGERTLLDQTVPAGEAVRERVIVVGDDALLQTFVNDIFFQAWRP